MEIDNLEILNKAFSLADDPTYSIPIEIGPINRTLLRILLLKYGVILLNDVCGNTNYL